MSFTNMIIKIPSSEVSDVIWKYLFRYHIAVLKIQQYAKSSRNGSI